VGGFVERLFAEIQKLEIEQRRALLLNMTDSYGYSIEWFGNVGPTSKSFWYWSPHSQKWFIRQLCETFFRQVPGSFTIVHSLGIANSSLNSRIVGRMRINKIAVVIGRHKRENLALAA